MEYKEIMNAVKQHHKYIEALGYTVVMTSLIGSQNYSLSDEQSDIDTFSLIFPPFEDIANVREPVAGEFEVEDGKCMYKDIRMALNLLKKPSPNSTEIFASNYIYVNPQYSEIIRRYMHEHNLNRMLHSNYTHMLYACAGMARQLIKRNMPAGKRYSHALRLEELVSKYCDYLPTYSLFVMGLNRNEALAAKRNTLNKSEEWYNCGCERIAQQLDDFGTNFKLTEQHKSIEAMGQKLIEDFQIELTKKYLGVEK